MAVTIFFYYFDKCSIGVAHTVSDDDWTNKELLSL
jgi:hypothetical protein